MTGMEKITRQIAGDARQEAEAILAQGRAQAEEILAGYQAQAGQLTQEILNQGAAQAAQAKERLISAAGQEERKGLLAAKQELLDQAFQLALDRLCSLPEGEYVDLLAQLVAQASYTGREQLIFSRWDRARFGVKTATRANDLLAKEGRPANLTLSQETRDFRGGVILADGKVEMNCTFETLIRLGRSEAAGEAAKVLFA